MRSRHVAAVFLAMLAAWQLAESLYIPVKALFAQILLRDAWARTGSERDPALPWPWADTWPVARLRSARHGVDLIVLSGVSGSTLAFGPGHMDGSALPGEPGHTVLSGHRDTHFRFLKNVQTGDVFFLETPDGARRTYRVTDTSVVDSRSHRLQIDYVRDRLTLVTCYPFNGVNPGGPLRYQVTALPAIAEVST